MHSTMQIQAQVVRGDGGDLNRRPCSAPVHVPVGWTSTAPLLRFGGRVRRCTGNLVSCTAAAVPSGIGDLCWIERNGGKASPSRAFSTEGAILGEVVGFDESGVTVAPYEEVDGLSLGARVWFDRGMAVVRPDASWRGRVLDALGRPIDNGPLLHQGVTAYPIQARAIPAHRRAHIGTRLRLGVRALDLFTPCCVGQRLGIFAGSGVGKSSLMSMIARGSDADVMVIGLIGERGRELGEFLERTLGPEGRARSVLVVATSDMPAMMRRRAAYLTLAVAEYFRDQGQTVLCLLDSVTRFAMALREIYLAAGEPPTTKGYPPSVFAELPRLLERAGPGEGRGSITGLFTVLVEGDDTNEPIADTVRGILDGHVVLDRRIAEAGRYPAVDVLRSISRTAPGCYAPDERATVARARRLMSAYADMAELIQLGAYRAGSNPQLDEAIAARPALEDLLRQSVDEPPAEGSPFVLLEQAIGVSE